MGTIRAKASFAKAYLFNPMNRIWQSSDLPELAFSIEKWNLDADQLDKTLAILTEELPGASYEYAWCFNPHHMIVIYDQDGAILGHVKICFKCHNYIAFPPPLVMSNSITYFHEIVRQMDMPIFDDELAYRKLFEGMKMEALLFDNTRVEVPEAISRKI